jgi:hypothetical protein
MEALVRMIAGLKKFEQLILDTVRSTLEQYDYIALDMVAQDQLYERGIDGDGRFIADTQPYAAFTIAVKQAKGQPTNRVTLRDEGDFHASFKLEFYDTYCTIVATDEKTEALMLRYGHQILNLTDENVSELAQNYVAPAITELLKNYASSST